MEFADVQVNALLRVTVGKGYQGVVGKVTKVNPKKKTVALQVSGKIAWFKADKLEPYYHGK